MKCCRIKKMLRAENNIPQKRLFGPLDIQLKH